MSSPKGNSKRGFWHIPDHKAFTRVGVFFPLEVQNTMCVPCFFPPRSLTYESLECYWLGHVYVPCTITVMSCQKGRIKPLISSPRSFLLFMKISDHRLVPAQAARKRKRDPSVQCTDSRTRIKKILRAIQRVSSITKLGIQASPSRPRYQSVVLRRRIGVGLPS